MEDVYTRARYSRYGGNTRRRRKASGGGFAAKVARQVFISALILSALWSIKGIDSPVTTHVIKGIKWVVEKSVEPKMMYDSIKNLFKRAPSVDDAIEAKEDGERGGGLYSGQNEGSYAGRDEGVSAGRDATAYAGNVLSAGVRKDGSTTLILPLDGYIAVPFGEREHHLSKTAEFHCGVDIAAKEKVEVLAVLGGHVVEIGSNDNYGLYLKIDHGNGRQTVYGHCSEILVKAGDEVNQGDVVASIKSIGTAESHLHFELWEDGMPVDPLPYLEEEYF